MLLILDVVIKSKELGETTITFYINMQGATSESFRPLVYVYTIEVIDIPVDINVNGDSVEIALGVTVDSTCKVKSVAEKIQQKIKDEVQNMTGIIVTRVNVNIDGIIFDNQ